ncbi:MAG TPA: C4-type zinc ribbon domain-containing protein [Anaeromyxobacter sp.]|nr:C4-type zinc ribbon domain-containing protein [Anaeromyxobacter sp.]
MPSLREKLKALEELQQIDLEVNEVKAELEGIGPRRAEVEVRVKEARRSYDDEQGRLDGNERERRQLETLLGMERDKVKKWEGRLGEIRTPREYAALSREIDIARKTNDSQSEQLRALTAQAAEIQKALEERAEWLAEQEEATQGELKELDERQAEVQRRLQQLEARRGEAAHAVEPSLLGKYENIKRRRAGVALAPVVGMTCKGCHRNVPPQLAITLQRADSIETCPNCHRIIYAAEALNPPAPSPA